MQCQWQNFQCKLCISKYEINDRHRIKTSMLMICTYYEGQNPRQCYKVNIFIGHFFFIFSTISQAHPWLHKSPPHHLNPTSSPFPLVRQCESPSWFDATGQSKRSMSNGAFEIHAHAHHSQWMLGNLVLRFSIKTDRSATVNYNEHILF